MVCCQGDFNTTSRPLGSYAWRPQGSIVVPVYLFRVVQGKHRCDRAESTTPYVLVFDRMPEREMNDSTSKTHSARVDSQSCFINLNEFDEATFELLPGFHTIRGSLACSCCDT